MIVVCLCECGGDEECVDFGVFDVEYVGVLVGMYVFVWIGVFV